MLYMQENTSGMGLAAVVPNEIMKWNWGAFLMSWIWGVCNGTMISLLCFVPVVNLAMPFILGAKGNEWAWRNKRWASVQHFQAVQRQWTIAGVILLGVMVVASLATLFMLGVLFAAGESTIRR
jgi:hypothetical protein